MWMMDHLGSWTEAKGLSLQWVPPCSRTNLAGSGLMVPLLCSGLGFFFFPSSIPGAVGVTCDGSGGASL